MLAAADIRWRGRSQHAAFGLLKSDLPAADIAARDQPRAAASRRLRCLRGICVKRRQQGLAPGLHGGRILRQARTEHVGAHAAIAPCACSSAASIASPSASSPPSIERRQQSRQLERAGGCRSHVVNACSWSRSSRAFSTMAAAASADGDRLRRVEAGPQEREQIRVDQRQPLAQRAQRVETNGRSAATRRVRRGAAPPAGRLTLVGETGAERATATASCAMSRSPRRHARRQRRQPGVGQLLHARLSPWPAMPSARASRGVAAFERRRPSSC